MDRRRPMMAAMATLSIALVVPAANAQKMYWTDTFTEKIQRADLDGAGIEDLVTGLDFPVGIALDPAAGKMYWCETIVGPDKVQRANLDGSDVEDAVVGLDVPSGIALDPAAGKVYWTVGTTGDVLRANLDGTGVETLIDLASGHINYLAVDPVGGKLYFTVLAGESVQRAELDGSNREVLVPEMDNVFGIALDLGADRMYWARSDAILRANLDGSGAETIGSIPNATAIALDLGRSKIYWTSVFQDKIRRANLDGSNVEDLVTGLETPRGIALDLSTPTHTPGGGVPATVLPTITSRPNPFDARTTIRYSLPRHGPIRLDIYGPAGQLVKRLVESVRPAGEHALTWTGQDDTGAHVAAGTYFVLLRAGGETRTRKVVYLGGR